MSTWKETAPLWPCPQLMESQLLSASGKDAWSCTFEQPGFYLIATTPKGKRWKWDDTTGIWTEIKKPKKSLEEWQQEQEARYLAERLDGHLNRE